MQNYGFAYLREFGNKPSLWSLPVQVPSATPCQLPGNHSPLPNFLSDYSLPKRLFSFGPLSYKVRPDTHAPHKRRFAAHRNSISGIICRINFACSGKHRQ